jgi:hypothetical protein
VVVVIKDDHNVDREYQRDAGMVLLKKPRPSGTRLCSKDDLNLHALKEGEIIILKDEPEAKDWYCAEIRVVLADRMEVNYSLHKRRRSKTTTNAQIRSGRRD